ncbi:MAG: hypothetical protein DMG89_04910 [Acidobacteria bacterium]|nr:MAG: hypothetical protein DMG89_04910 [Acidobacteriota bacterium]
MTDFLTSIVARSFGTAPAIRPRTASLFEPLRPEPTPLALEADAIQAAEISVAIEADREMPAATEQGNRQPRLPTHSSDRAEAAEFGHGQNNLPARLTRDGALKHEMETLSPASTKEFRDADEPVPVALNGQQMDSRLPSPEWHDAQPALRPEPTPVSAMRVPESSSPFSALRTRDSEWNQQRPLVPSRTAASLAVELRNSVVLRKHVPQTQVQETSSLAVAPEPDIHVTIGRIEVRANAENVPTRSSRSTSSVMSLEEYLRRRARRGGH